jgi:ubiquinone/menaquinone biosynthesis C-methylase UbiE
MKTSPSPDLYMSCPICSASELRHLWVVNGYTVAKCNACTLVFVQNKVSAEELAAHYASGTDDAYDDSNVECLNYYYDKLGSLIRSHFPRPGRVLDLGCSRGWFLEVMKGWECHGNEIIASDAAIARERFGDRIVVGSFEDYPLRENYFDVITLQDVFDHFRDPMTALEKCHRMLRPGGLIVIKVHNISCLYAKFSGANFYAIIPPSHLFYYDNRTLNLTLSKSGFQVIDSKFIGHLLKIKTVFWRLSRSNVNSFFYRIYKVLDTTSLGEIKFQKNLHDIITVLAKKSTGELTSELAS